MTLKCALISDMHYGYSQNTHRIHEKFYRRLAKENIDVLFIAGDLAASKQNELERSFKLIRRFLPSVKIFFTEGNHDWWSGRPQKMPWDDNPSLGVNYRMVYESRRTQPIYSRPISYGEMRHNHKQYCLKYDINHLDGNAFDLNDEVVVMGFNGWYHTTNLQELGTNDYRYMPEMIESSPMHQYLDNKAYHDLDKILNIDTKNKIVVLMTHFPPFTEDANYLRYCANPRWLDPMADKADFLLVGHSHKQCDYLYKDCRVINAGIDETQKPYKKRYNKPRYHIFFI